MAQRQLVRFMVACLLLLVGSGSGTAQVTTGAIFGMVVDESRGVLPVRR